MNLMTIVIEYEGDEPPFKGFGVKVAGCAWTWQLHRGCIRKRRDTAKH